MIPRIKIVNPLCRSDWDTIVLSTNKCTIFHSQAWCSVLKYSYGYKPYYFMSIENGKLSILIPFMEINTFFSPKRGISLPFTDFCPLILSDNTLSQHIIEVILNYARTFRWKYIELRDGSDNFDDAIATSRYFEHNLDLKKSEKELFSSFRSSTKRNIKKAIKFGVQVKRFYSYKAIRESYKLNCLTRKYHGLPPQPYYFFKNIYTFIIAKEKGFVLLAKYDGKIIAGAVFFHFGNNAIYKYGASKKKYQHLRANNLVMWEAIKWYSLNGYDKFSFGRTEIDNHGLLQFKRGWGTQETIVDYYKYDIFGDKFIGKTIRHKKLNVIARKLPIPFLRIAGLLMYKHFG